MKKLNYCKKLTLMELLQKKNILKKLKFYLKL